MDQSQHQYLSSQQPHMSEGPSYAAQGSTANGMTQYPQFQQSQQPPALQPAPNSYAPSPSYNHHYNFQNGLASPHASTQSVSSSMGQHMGSGLPPLPTMTAGGATSHTYVGNPSGPQPPYQQSTPDVTGQVAPSGMKPRVTATLWEDEGCMCFQIEASGICVARRDDNHMINGTKLLNVAGMTRGRRDGILKSEKTRHVVKIGPMHLKGVWIPFDRALDFANKEKITEKLYPLFVHNIGALLYHPTNQSRTNAVMAAADRRRLDNSKQPGGMVGPPGPQPPNLTHHHTMNSNVTTQQSNSMTNQSNSARPGLDRAHTFPTPPTSASGTVTGMGNQWGSYDSAASSMANGVPASQYEHHPHSTPATPATTPPGSSLPSLQQYQGNQNYDNARSMYPTNSSQSSHYGSQPSLHNQAVSRTGTLQSSVYAKQEMGPPGALGSTSKSETDHGEQKLASYLPNAASEPGPGDDEAEHDPDTEYAQDHKYGYDAHRSQYNGMTGHQSAPGQMTPLSSTTTQSMWAGGYQTPRAPPSSNLYNPTSDTRGALPNGSVTPDGHIPGAYAPTQMNGMASSNKRSRDDDDTYQRNHGDDIETLKRRKMSRDGIAGNVLPNGAFDDSRQINRAKSNMTPRTTRR